MSDFMRVPDPKGDVSKLSKWAQQYIANLERRIRELEDYVKEISSEYPNSNVMLQGGVTHPDVGLPNDSCVYFYLDDGEGNRERLFNMIEVHHNHGEQTLSITSYGRGYLNVSPQSGNAIRIWIGK